MNQLNDILNDLRSQRLWPVMVGLVVALIAVPVLLAKSSHAPAQTAGIPSPATGNPTLPTVVAQSTPSTGKLSGRQHDPFGGGAGGQVTAATTATSARSASASGTSRSSSTTPRSSGSSSHGSSTSTSGGTPTVSSPGSTTPKPIVPATGRVTPKSPSLTATQDYRVKLAISYPSGGLNTIDPVQRLTVLPNDHQPLLVELGVLRGGKHVLFSVQPGTLPSGPGTCTPGPIDCQILSLAPGQNENLSAQSPSGSTEVALFAVTAIGVHDFGSTAAALRARRLASAAGRAVLASSQRGGLGLFRYEPRFGAVVDLRNLSIGGS